MKHNPAQILRQEKGVALILSVVILGIILLIFVFASTTYFNNMTTELNRERDRIVAIQVMQEFAVRAQEANFIWWDTAGNCASKAATQRPAGKEFCWSNSPGIDICVNNPQTNATYVQKFCLDGAKLDIAGTFDIVPRYGPGGRMVARLYDLWHNLGPVTTIVMNDVTNHMGEAWAVIPPNASLPDIGPGLPTADINQLTCNSGAPGSDYCKHCLGAAAGPNMACVELRVCTSNAPLGCVVLTDWFREEVGLLDR